MAPFDVSAAGVARGAGECPFLWKAGCVRQLREGGHARPATPSRLGLEARPLQDDPEELRHPRRQIEGGHVAGHVEQLQAEERHYVADDDPNQDDLSRDPQGCACGDPRGGRDS